MDSVSRRAPADRIVRRYERPRMFEYRITKYDPAQRDPDGAYRRDEWTSFSDIGKSFGGQMLTEENYAKTEQAYLMTVANFCAEARIHYLTIVGLEN